jgi:hypothetical protein
MRTACYHARRGFPNRQAPDYGQPITVIIEAPRGVKPRNALIRFSDGRLMITNRGCYRFRCQHLNASGGPGRPLQIHL